MAAERNQDKAGAAARPVWPDGKRACVMLAFDLDGPTGGAMLDGSIWRNPEYFTLGAYGPWRALPRLLDLLDDAGLPATFFTPTWVVEHWPAQCRAIVERGHEVAHHGHRHESFWAIDSERQRAVLAHSASVFHRVLGIRAVGFRTPSGDWRAETPALLAEAGIRYSSSMRGDDRPYLVPVAGRAEPLVEIPARWDFDDYASLAYHRGPDFPAGHDRIASYAHTLDNWKSEFDGHWREGLCLTTLLHPKVSGKPGRLAILEALFAHMRGREGVWFARGSEVADWWLRTQGATP